MNDQGVVFSDVEIMANLNKLVSYAEFLNSSMEEYERILGHCTSEGIRDERIASRINTIAAELKAYTGKLEEICTSIKVKAQLAEREIALIDHYDFPVGNFSYLESLINQIVR